MKSQYSSSSCCNTFYKILIKHSTIYNCFFFSFSAKESPKESGTFVVFHSKGISAYDPLRCLLRHQIPGDFSNFKFIPEALEGPLTLCLKGKDCQWGEAVRVGTEFIYVCQPDQNRIIVMNSGDSWNPLQVTITFFKTGSS